MERYYGKVNFGAIQVDGWDNLSGAIDDVVIRRDLRWRYIVAETDIKTNNSMPSGKTKSELEREKRQEKKLPKKLKTVEDSRHDLEDSKIELMDED